MTIKSLLVALALVLAAGCEKTNPYYCPNAVDNNCATGGIDAPSNTSCAVTACATGVCDTVSGDCVQCTATQSAACTMTTPVCGSDNTCGACTSHSQCTSSHACLPDGSCGADNVAYVASSQLGGTSNSVCTVAMPCSSVASALATAKPYIKISGTIDEAVSIDSTDVTIIADAGAILQRTGSSGAVLQLTGTSHVTIYDLSIMNAVSSTGIGVYVPGTASGTLTLDRVIVANNGGHGIDVSGGKITMSRCVVSGNTNGGAYIAADFNITNSLFVANGGGLSTTGGLTLGPATSNYAFQFNTVADNLSSTGTVASRGLNCVTPVTMSNIIATGNQSASNCAYTYSLFDTSASVTGTNMTTANPQFRNTDPSSPAATDFYRIASNSPAVDQR